MAGTELTLVDPIVTMPPEEMIYETPRSGLEIASHSRLTMHHTVNNLLAKVDGVDNVQAEFHIAPGVMVPRRLRVSAQIVIDFADATNRADSAKMEAYNGLPIACKRNEAIRLTIQSYTDLITLNCNPFGSILEAATVELDGRKMYGNPRGQWVVDQARMSSHTRSDDFDQANNCNGYEINNNLFGGRQRVFIHGEKVPYKAKLSHSFSTEGDNKMVFDIVEYLPVAGLFVDEATSTHLPSITCVQNIVFNLKFHKAYEMLRVLQPGLAPGTNADEWGYHKRVTAVADGDKPLVYIRGPTIFTLETINPQPNLLGMSSAAILTSNHIEVKTFPIQNFTNATLSNQAFYPSPKYNFNSTHMFLKVIPSAIYAWVEDNNKTEQALNPIGRGSLLYLANIKISYGNIPFQLVNTSQTDLMRITGANGGIRVDSAHYAFPEVVATVNPNTPSFDRHCRPTPGTVYCFSPCMNLNNQIPQTPGMMYSQNLEIDAGFAAAQPFIGIWPPRMEETILGSTSLKVALVTPAMIEAGAWTVQIGTCKGSELTNATGRLLGEPSFPLLHREVLAAPLPYRGHHISLQGGGLGSFFHGLYNKGKQFLGNFWDNLKKDPIKMVGDGLELAGKIGALGAGGITKKAKERDLLKRKNRF